MKQIGYWTKLNLRFSNKGTYKMIIEFDNKFEKNWFYFEAIKV